MFKMFGLPIVAIIMCIGCCLKASQCVINNTSMPQVYIDNDEFKGSIVGKRIQDAGVDYFAFRGIPYARAPINELRFKVSFYLKLFRKGIRKCFFYFFKFVKDPMKLNRFEGTLDATHDGFECCSITARNESEDCLNLNVYTKQVL